MNHLNGKFGYKYNHHDVQNEPLNIMGVQALQKLAIIRNCQFFSIMGDKGTDISNRNNCLFVIGL